jgi:hypothetical protein
MHHLLFDVVSVGLFKDEIFLGRGRVECDDTLFVPIVKDSFIDLCPHNATPGSWRTSDDGVAVLNLRVDIVGISDGVNGIPPSAPVLTEQALCNVVVASDAIAEQKNQASSAQVQGSPGVQGSQSAGSVQVQGSPEVQGCSQSSGSVQVQGSLEVQGCLVPIEANKNLPGGKTYATPVSMKGVHHFVIDDFLFGAQQWRPDLLLNTLVHSPAIPTLTRNYVTINNFAVGFDPSTYCYPEATQLHAKEEHAFTAQCEAKLRETHRRLEELYAHLNKMSFGNSTDLAKWGCFIAREWTYNVTVRKKPHLQRDTRPDRVRWEIC